MTSTEIILFKQYASPVVRLDSICDAYLQIGRQEALRQASLNRLPFPTFRLSESRKAPVMIKLTDLARHIDTAHGLAQAQWQHSQI
jgi:hypothetical protein